MITYEQPLNERIRLMLRLEDLFSQTQYNLEGNSVWDSRATLSGLLEIENAFERSDLKGEIIKELERHLANLDKLQQSPGVDIQKLSHILQRLSHHIETLQQMSGKVKPNLNEIYVIQSVKQRISIPGGTCNFDLPIYHYWLAQPYEQRFHDLSQWISVFKPLEEAVRTVLQLTRNYATPKSMTAKEGFYQQNLEASTAYQLIRVSLPRELTVYPEMSANKHLVNIRFLDQKDSDRPSQTAEDVVFELSCCAI